MNNAASTAPVHVATITIDKAFDLDRAHESAAQYHTIRVEPGAYRVELRDDGRGWRYLVAIFHGVCLHSGYGGNRDRDAEGKDSEVTVQPYKYLLRGGRFYGAVEIHDAATMETARGA